MEDNNLKFDIVRPDPESFLQSARSFGYGLETAIADLIDNSITAKATKIHITYGIDKFTSYLRIEDNGIGMDEKQLLTAMKVGSSNPNKLRQSHDLGRFGLGLKTASFSQCRRLTVKSASDSQSVSTKCWDLDLVEIEQDWVLLRGCTDNKSEEKLGTFTLDSKGTIVLWEKLDRLLESEESNLDKTHFYRKFENVKIHLGLIFHRFIEDEGIVITVLNESVRPLNPFHLSLNSPSSELQEEQLSINGKKVTIQPYILPHETKLLKDEREQLQMLRGWTEHQGIYLYRNKRLISDGNWLDLNFRIKENQRLCRIAIDIPNTLDKEWQIDVKKASAKIPDLLRQRIKEICIVAIEKAVKVYTHRGAYLKRKGSQQGLIFFWKAKLKQGKKFYEINVDHPIYKLIHDNLGPGSYLFKDYIKQISETIPIALIVNDFSDPRILMKEPFEEAHLELVAMYQSTLKALIDSGVSKQNALEQINQIECFQKVVLKPYE
ncbi:ATP-binding protein [Pedobacter caeni]|uniref:Histidine kinase-, DNA gyrase B-, and HSP90-like ATPase n=1 Tax=Pedobacter caeni TaxID=288992 RepID=A0A1M5JNJ5_9SPHI|nr:ATP-binding protein [Pedobacter caeni]SHG42101.1 Histidine kinase-, DNA gyrase B-, and HSP90-like ATPase [Pedobacter caeni]